MEEEGLNFLRALTFQQRIDSMKQLSETISSEGGAKPGKIYLPESVPGSWRQMKKLQMNAYEICKRYGTQTLFITFTCNTDWPEIKNNVVSEPSAYDVPGITARVFKEKLRLFLKRLRMGEFTDKKKI